MNYGYLTRYERIYLASPYTLYRKGPSAAYSDVAAIAADMMREGVCVFSPIVYGHTLVMLGWLNPMDEAFWLHQNTGHQDGCDVLVIAKMDGWQDSAGISSEFAHAYMKKQPIYYLDPETKTVLGPLPQ